MSDTNTYEGKPNQLIAVTEARQFMVKHTNSKGVESMFMVLAFGTTDYNKPNTSPEDRKVGLYVLAGDKELSEKLNPLSQAHAAPIISLMEAKGYAQDGKLVAGVATPAPSAADVSHLFDEDPEGTT